MADDDLPTRLQWPADPLDPTVTDPAPAPAPARTADPASGGGSPSPAVEPRWVLGERNEVALLRKEVSDLRHSIDDLADRVQLRQLKASFDELRGEVIALRRVVVEWPELDQLTSEVGALRSHMIDVQENPPPTADASLLSALADVQAGIEAIGTARGPVAALGPLVEELGAVRHDIGTLRADMAALRRRVALRVQSSDTTIDDDQLDRVVESVVERVQASVPATTSRRRR